MANEAGLETVLSAAYSLKHASDMEKSFPTQDEAFDKAKQMGLSPEQAARQITSTPTGQFSLYDAKKGEIVKSDRWRPPDFRTLVKIAQTEQGRSEISCVFEEVAKRMIFSEETGPAHFTFANQVGLLISLSPIKLVCKPTMITQTGLYPTHNPKPSLAGQFGNLIRLYAILVSNFADSTGTSS